MTEEELSRILENHKHWIAEDCDGWENMRADLCGANLRHAALCGADLRCANLRDADLRDADLRCANLCNADLVSIKLSGANLTTVKLISANLCGADLRCANLRDADLCDTSLCNANLIGANLCNADLRCANLCGADLCSADLRCANLCGADLSHADLRCANLRDADLIGVKGELIEYRKGKILKDDINGYKKCKNDIIVTLLIPRGAIVFSINGSMCRTNRAKVISIDGADRAYSTYKNMSYYVGDEFTIYDFNCEYNVECGEGIHFFTTREKAEDYLE